MIASPKVCVLALLAMLGGISAPAYATVQITSLTPSAAAPQLLGTTITWTAVATDSNPGPLTFQFNVGIPGGNAAALVKDFNVGTLSAGQWTSQPFVWTPTMTEGIYQIQVVIKDFTSGETASQTNMFQVNPLVSPGGTPVAVATANPLVALFSAPGCAAGSSMRVSFQSQSSSRPATTTKYLNCHPPTSMNFEIAGMYPSATYNMFSQTMTGGTTVNGPTITFTTGAIPKSIPIPAFQQVVPAGAHTYLTDDVLLLNPFQFGGGPAYASVATDLAGGVMWYYTPQPPQSIVMTRPLSNATFLTLQGGAAWDSGNAHLQYLRQIDLAGNIIKETNIGVIQQQLLALGATDGGPCSVFSQPAPVGAACLDAFSHDAIQTLPNGDTAVLIDAEKIYPAGTQGNTSGLPVDILGEMVLVLNSNWQVIWYFDAFEHATGAPQLDITRPAVLGESCAPDVGGTDGCPPLSLLGPGIAPDGNDWIHGNAIYYWPQEGDFIWSSRHQDWVMKIDYRNGAGTGNILWLLGPCGTYTFNNIYNDSWPWNSHQHEVGIENSGAGPLTLFDNGNTRVSQPGASTGCMQGVGSGDSRGMSLTFNEKTLEVTPVLSVDLGVYSTADGSAQLLPDGHYFYLAAVVFVNISTESSFSIEILPAAGTDTGKQVLNLEGPSAYRAWRVPNMYNPPIT